MRIIIAMLALGLVAGCAAGPLQQQNEAGQTRLDARFQVPEGEAGPVRIEFVDAKDKLGVTVTAKLKDGTEFSYAAEGVTGAVEAARIRAAVEQAVSADLRDAAPGVVDSIVDGIVRGLVP